MSEEMYICDGDKYKLGKGGAILLPVNVTNIPDSLEIERNNLLLSPEFHVTLFYLKRLTEKNVISIPNFAQKVIKDFCEFIKDNDISFIRYTGEYRFVQDDRGRKAVFAMCEISNSEKFFNYLNEKYKLNLEHPPMHVTLYMLERGKGISVIDQKDLDTKTKVISDPLEGILFKI